MKVINRASTWLIVAIMSIFYACSSGDEEVNPEKELSELYLLSEHSIPNTDLKVRTYTYMEDLIVGYNKFQFLVEKSGMSEAFTNVEISIKSMMDMGTMMHACPIENPVLGTEFESALGGAAVFVMPSGDMGRWTMTLKVTDKDTDHEGEVTFPVNIKLPDEARLRSFSMGDDKYFVSLVEPFQPQVGINDFVVAVHKKASMTDWPPEQAFEISIEPEMPDMGHGSPNNVDPVHVKDGHYQGKVNFTMDGYWKVNLDLDKDNNKQELSFDITFEHSSTN